MTNYEALSLIIYSISALIALIVAFIAIKNYRKDIDQKKLQNTIYFIQSFEHSKDWFSDKDRKNWNKLINSMRRSCAKFEISKEIYLPSIFEKNYKDIYGETETVSINEIFIEGPLMEYGESIENIMSALEFIAQAALKKKLDIELINFRLIDYCFLASIFQDFLGNKNSNVHKLYKKLNYNKPILRKGYFEI